MLCCASGFFLTEGNTCVRRCPAGTGPDEQGNCNTCPENCATCGSTTAGDCNSCKEGFNFLEGACVDDCGAGFYPTNGFCASCHDNCETCTDGSRTCGDDEEE